MVQPVQESEDSRQMESKRPNMLVKTCDNCAKGKIRCIRNGETGPCDRCKRLGKQCHYREVRNANSGLQKDRDRIDVLEAKVDQMLALFPVSVQSEDNVTSGTPGSLHQRPGDVVDKGLLTMEAASLLFDDFRSTLAPYCPFLVIPSHLTSGVMRREKPFLFLAILTAALYDNMPMQRIFESELKKSISYRMVFDGAISFEVLQGLLVHITWCQYHSRPRRFSQYLHLALSIINDLQLDRPPELRFCKTRVSFDDPDKEKERLSWGREEQRAIAGCFYISSSTSHILQKQNPFPYQPIIGEYCESLARDLEFPSDINLLHIVQLQYLSERMTSISMENFPENQSVSSGIQNRFQELRSELEAYRANIKFPLNENHMIFMQFHTTELYLCQVTLFDYKPNTPSRKLGVSFQIEVLCIGLKAAKRFLDFYVSLPLRAEVGFNNTGWVQIGFVLTIACKLVITACEPSVYSHTADLCRSLDLSILLNKCILRIQYLITSHMDASGDRDVFYHYEKRIKRVQWWYETRKLSNSNDSNTTYSPRPSGTYDTMLPLPARENYFGTSNLEGNQSDYSRVAPVPDILSQEEAFDIQWPAFFPDTSFDQIFGDWVMQTTLPSEQELPR